MILYHEHIPCDDDDDAISSKSKPRDPMDGLAPGCLGGGVYSAWGAGRGPPVPLVPSLRPPFAAPQSDDSYPLHISFTCDLMEVAYVLPPWLSGSYITPGGLVLHLALAHPPARGFRRRARELRHHLHRREHTLHVQHVLPRAANL